MDDKIITCDTDDDYDDCVTYSQLLDKISYLNIVRNDSESRYRMTGNATDEYNHIIGTKVLDGDVLYLADRMMSERLYSLALATFYRYIASLIINAGDRANLDNARIYLNNALKVLNTIYYTFHGSTSDIVYETVTCRWLNAITYKIDKNYGIAEDMLNCLYDYTLKKYNKYISSHLDYSRTVLIPRRELAIIHQSEDEMDSLIADSNLYSDNDIETFYTYRRVFEFYCEHDLGQKATDIRPMLRESFSKCEDKLYEVYRLALEINKYEYQYLFGDKSAAEDMYEDLHRTLVCYSLVRYLDKLETIHDRLVNNKTFSIN